MRIAYLICGHKNIEQISRLVDRLASPYSDIYLHLDKKSDCKPTVNLLDKSKIIKNNIDVRWGCISLVYSYINSLSEIFESGVVYTHICLLSGQCYPLKNNDDLREFYRINIGREFLSNVEISPNFWGKAIYRYKYFHFDQYLRQDKIKFFFEIFANKLFSPRRLSCGYQIYGGSAWWILSQECCMFVCDFLKKNRDFYRFFKFTEIPDEMLFHTIIMNSKFRDKVVNNNFRYIDWSAGGSNPKILTIDDFDKMSASNCLFARKFDASIDSLVLDKLDALAGIG